MQKIIAKHALIPIAAGIGAIAVVIYVEHEYLPEPAPGQSILYSLLPYSTKFLDHLAIAFLSLGVIGLLLELPHLQKYFYGLFVDALSSDDFVKERSRDSLWAKRIETTILTTVFGEDIKRPGSFFYDYYDQLRNFIGAPYRDKYAGTTTVKLSETQANAFDVEEVVSFRCCKMGERIAPEIGWTAHRDELIDMPFFKVEIKVPDDPNPIVIQPNPPDLKPHPDWGRMQSLEQYKDKGGLEVKMEVHYVVATDRAFATNMGLITKDLTWTINYPQDLKIQVDRFVLDDSVEPDDKTPGKCTYTYPHWVLPGDGFAFHFRKL